MMSHRTIDVPVFPRLDEYVGAWAIESRAASAMWELAQSTDLVEHIRAASPRERDDAVRMPIADGQSIAMVLATGTLMKQVPSLSSGTSTIELRRQIRTAANDPEVAAILIAIDSPGGTVAGMGDLAADVRRARELKPVWAQIEDLGASAAYWLASQTSRIFANDPTALVGSIGTILVVRDLSVAAAQAGIKTLVFATGDLKGAGVPGTEINSAGQAYFQRIVDAAQTVFDDAVMQGRGLTGDALARVKTGEVFSAQEALALGLIDGVQRLDETLAALKAEVQKSNKTRGARMASEPIKIEVEADLETARAQVAAEADRVHAIKELCASAPGGSPTMVVDGARVSIESHAIAQGWGIKETSLAIFRASRAANAPAVQVRSQERDSTLEVMQAAMVMRARGRVDRVHTSMALPSWMRADVNDPRRNEIMERAWKYRDLSMLDLCREALRLDGRDVPLDRESLIHAAFSGGSLTNIFTTSINAVLLTTYMEGSDTTREWTRESEVADFKLNERPRMQIGAGLHKLPRGGEADHYSRSDVGESFKIARYASQLTIDEQDIIDDSMGALADSPVDMANAALRLRPDLVYSILLANPTLTATGRALFNSTDGNLDTSSALASTTLRTGVSTMQLFRENGVNLNLTPTHLLVGPSLRHLSYELCNSSQILIARGGTTDTTVERGNLNALAADGIKPVVDARLENGVVDPDSETTYAGSSTTWRLVSAMAKTIEVAYLRGTGRAPRVRSYTLSEGRFGIGWDVTMDIGAKALDWRGFYEARA